MGYVGGCCPKVDCCQLKYMGSAYFYSSAYNNKGGMNMGCCGKPGGGISRPAPIGRPGGGGMGGPSPFGPRR